MLAHHVERAMFSSILDSSQYVQYLVQYLEIEIHLVPITGLPSSCLQCEAVSNVHRVRAVHVSQGNLASDQVCVFEFAHVCVQFALNSKGLTTDR